MKQITKRWQKYFQQLIELQTQDNEGNTLTLEIENQEYEKETDKIDIKKQKNIVKIFTNGKVPGNDTIYFSRNNLKCRGNWHGSPIRNIK